MIVSCVCRAIGCQDWPLLRPIQTYLITVAAVKVKEENSFKNLIKMLIWPKPFPQTILSGFFS